MLTTADEIDDQRDPRAVPLSDLTDLGAAPPQLSNPPAARAPAEMPDLTLHRELPPEKPAASTGHHGEYETKISELESELADLAGKRQRETTTLRTDTNRLVEQLRAEAMQKEAKLAADFSAELEQLVADKDEQMARLEAEYKTVIALQQKELSQLRANREHAAAHELQSSTADFQKELAALTARHESAFTRLIHE